MKHVLITGGVGFIGSNVVKLMKRGIEVTVLDVALYAWQQYRQDSYRSQ